MPSVCLYFQIHQPYRIDSRAQVTNLEELFDVKANSSILKSVAKNCYVPTNNLLQELFQTHGSAFKASLSISGVALEQLELYAPDALESFVRLSQNVNTELLSETYYHSLASVFDTTEFIEQIELHTQKLRKLFHLTPTVFRNTELIYDNTIGNLITSLGFKGILAEGADHILMERSPNALYQTADSKLPLMLRNYRLSDDIGFRFSDRGWSGWPLTTEKFAAWIHGITDPNAIINIFLDYESFGEHQKAESGIFEFLRAFPGAILKKKGWRFLLPSEIIAEHKPLQEISFPRLTSWADSARDLTAWTGNNMQRRALSEAYKLGKTVHSVNNLKLTESWRRLLTSDHFYYMFTKHCQDGDIHEYFSPFANPYDAFILYMSRLNDVAAIAERLKNNPVDPESFENVRGNNTYTPTTSLLPL